MMGEKSCISCIYGAGKAMLMLRLCDGQAERPRKGLARSYRSFCFCHCGDTDMKTRPLSIPAQQDEISNVLKGHPHIFVAREDLSTSEVLCCGLTFRDLSQASIGLHHCLRFSKLFIVPNTFPLSSAAAVGLELSLQQHHDER